VHVLVVGGGVMGSTIALTAARGGWDVTVSVRSKAGAKRCRQQLDYDSSALSGIGVDTSWLARIDVVAEGEVPRADLIVEAVVEDLETKRAVIGRLQRRFPATPLWSTTSTIPASELAVGAPAPEKVIVAHFANPAHLVPVVEVVPGPDTAPDVTADCLRTLEQWGKRPALLRKEIRGFVFNRLQYAILREALALLRDEVIAPDDLETIVRYGYGPRLPAVGPLGMVNVTGLEMYVKVTDWLWPDLDSSLRSDVLHDRLERGERFMGWSDEDVQAAITRLRGELLERFGRDGPDGTPFDEGQGND
jgi:3-hydroxybutyryl-CoA dehydrogenase